MREIFTVLFSNSRRDRLTQSMQRFAYSLVEDTPCPDTAQETSFTYTRSLFYLEAVKAQPLALVGRRFSSSSDNADRDFLQFPPETIVDATSSSATVSCVCHLCVLESDVYSPVFCSSPVLDCSLH